ncbi:MAG: TlpA family protein disulfide reductase [Chloroflexi bacterium]|nr:TlpA family protein disulfide reductase [Chloroflexota bacterium]
MKSITTHLKLGVLVVLLTSLLLTACGAPSPTPTAKPKHTPVPTQEWDWFNMELTDAVTGETFTMNDYAGKVVLVETMAMWCPNCLVQAGEVRKLHELLGNPEDLVSVSLDVDLNEDEASLKQYVQEYGFEWHFAVAPLEVARSLGNLYTAQYLNPPLSPMLVIDRDGNVHHLEYGRKTAETLQKVVEPFLTP